jgi:pyruvate carboxylase
MDRALREFRIRGVKTNIPFLLNIVDHPTFRKGEATVNFILDHPELFKLKTQLDRATKMVSFIGDIVVNGNSDVKFTDLAKRLENPIIPPSKKFEPYKEGTKDLLTKLGPEGFCDWLKKEKKIQYTDTTMRDAHQSLLATRMRSIDMLAVAETFAKEHPQTFSMEVWGGATFDVCMRFLYENPWRRLADLRQAMPNTLLQMLLRGSNAVGYTAYPDNLIQTFVEQAWETGVDVFRIFDSLNWVKAMEPSISYVRNNTGGLAEVCLCYTGNILDPKRTKYNLKYYLNLAKDIENAGAHILAIKDMAGLLTPYAASELISALKTEVKLPIHLHTHDTSSLQAATYMKAIEAGVDVVDVALGGLSGLTSQPNFNAIVEMMRFHERENPYNIESLNQFSNYWETVREHYYPFESGLKAGTAEVFKHEIPGGQYSNLKPQAIALGLGDKFDEIKQRYADVNQLFGDIVKVTPSSKVVGDMAQYMVSNGLTVTDILENGNNISFPESVQNFFRGNLGQPDGGFPKELQKIVLRGETPFMNRPNAHLDPVDFDKEFVGFLKKFQKGFGRELIMQDFLSWKLYPKVWEDAHIMHLQYDDVSKIPTRIFFYGMKPHEETVFEIAPGKTVIVKLLSVGSPNDEGIRTVFFKVNGQTRNVQIADKHLAIDKVENQKADSKDKSQIGAPLQGLLSTVLVKNGQKVKENDPLFVIEAMKMESTVMATSNGIVKIHLKAGALVMADDLVVSLDN